MINYQNPLIHRALYPTCGPAPTWPGILRRFRKVTIASGHSCGRQLLVKLKGNHYLIMDGAYDIYTYLRVDDKDVQSTIDSLEK